MEINRYDIYLDIDFYGKRYTGEEDITVNNLENSIHFDAIDIEINEILFNGNKCNINNDDNGFTINNVSGSGKFHIKFSANVSRSLKGLYLAGSENEYILSTQFEESDARRAFPCVDHPAYKSVFHLKVSIDKELNAISNMPIRSESIEKDKKIIDFNDTPRMSSYLVYIGVGRFDERSDLYDGKRIYLTAMKGHLAHSDYPIEVAKKSLSYLENYTNIKYMLPKLHLISVPEFAAGAMENWGAITFREILLSIDSSSSNKSYKRTSEVITHELVHQWFGDLVTMKWWNDLWLNESFATFFAFKTVNDTEPEWHFYEDFLLDQTDGAYTMDSIVNSHPINAEVSDPQGVSRLSYEIRYGKGANVLRMLEAYIGDDLFMNGLRNYLKKFSYSNAAGSDLWASMDASSKKDISGMMNFWISKQGYPYIEVKSGERLKLRQSQFLFLEDRDETWPIPLFINRMSGTETLLFNSKEIELDSDVLSLNYNHNGFYRVLYDDTTYENIIKNIDKINSLERWGLANDLYAFLLSGKIDLKTYSNRIESLKKLNDALIIDEISKQFFNLYSITMNQYFLDELKFYAQEKMEFIEKNKKNDFNYTIVLASIYERLAHYDLEFDRKLLSEYNDYYKTDSNFRLSYLIARARIENNIDYLTDILLKASNDEDKTKAIYAISMLSGNDNYKKIMDLVSSGRVKKQDANSFFIAMSYNKDAREFLIENMLEIIDTLMNIKASVLRINRTVQTMISYAGLYDPERARREASKIKNIDIDGGIKKGLEFLNVFENLNKNIKL
ncbi:M1 family metallopeptidase [Picrophilus oshimae]|uniref:Aminopeptidase n=1 Tax=Picrophilus torridus (strain ATCC 700027 / DSM 9790 / JCM 10055 / NBRC 100828 / KAW 2/3) TaxID=1122961 RepID=A0A8G2FX29_PICTO|nr:M1 family metallopeptidase [Picrophilus oshimae]SMD31051.1 tricorn protease interacting factor F2/3 [Picrophilus oshimae DSM 9789]